MEDPKRNSSQQNDSIKMRVKGTDVEMIEELLNEDTESPTSEQKS